MFVCVCVFFILFYFITLDTRVLSRIILEVHLLGLILFSWRIFQILTPEVQ